MVDLANTALEYCVSLARRGKTMTEFEVQLYEASARYAATILNFQDACAQSALIKAERELHELQGRTG